MTRFGVAAAALVFGVLSTQVSAVPIGPGAFAATDALIDFDDLDGGAGGGLTDGDIVTNQYAGEGVVFANSFGNSHADEEIGALASANSNPNVMWSQQGNGSSGTGHYVELQFSSPVSRVGMGFYLSVGATFTLEIFSATDVLLESLTLNGVTVGTLDEGFAGLSSATDIAYARMSSLGFTQRSFNFSVDDVRFGAGASSSVPAPGTLALLGLAVAGLGLRRARR